jgi:uncharacterized protein
MQGKERLLIPGPIGPLEAEIVVPTLGAPKLFVMCHPHPSYQGTMDNKVVTTLTRTMNELGFISARFNYRGVGQSIGNYDKGRGETEDTLAVITYLKNRFKEATQFVLGGFSFGGFVAYEAALQTAPNALILVAPSVLKLGANASAEPRCSLLVIQGDVDETIPAAEVYAWLKTRKEAYTIKETAGASHFFHGKLPELHDTAQEFIRKVLP